MRILILTHAFDSLAQRLYVELAARGHDMSVEFGHDDGVMLESVDLFRPGIILVPHLTRAIPEAIWRHHLCLVVHPGIPGDRGLSALDRAIQRGEASWGVTVLQARAALDAGPVWAAAGFAMRPASKSSLYRNEVAEAAVRALDAALEHLPEYQAGRWRPGEPDAAGGGRWHPPLAQAERAIDWGRDDTASVLRKINAADGAPGVLDNLFGQSCHLYDAQAAAPGLYEPPGEALARRGGAILRATADGAVWIGHVRRPDAAVPVRLPATLAFPAAERLPEFEADGDPAIRYEESRGVGYLYFDFYDGAMGTRACSALWAAWRQARRRHTRVIVLMGGADWFSHGVDPSLIEAAASPPDEALRSLHALDDLCQAIVEAGGQLTIAALRGDAGAGGVFLALAADEVWARRGVMLDPQCQYMGNLYGSGYRAYLLPRRVGAARADALMGRRLPMGVDEARALGLIDADFGPADFVEAVKLRATRLAADPDHAARLAEKRRRRAADEAARPLGAYRAEALERLRRDLFGPGLHAAVAPSARTTLGGTPVHLARHRASGWVRPAGA